MIKEPEVFTLPSVSGEKIQIMCNWREGINGNFVKMRIGDGAWVVIERHAFVRAAMFLGNEKEQTDLVPVQELEHTELKKDYVIKVPRNMKAGERLRIPVRFDVILPKGTKLTGSPTKPLHL